MPEQPEFLVPAEVAQMLRVTPITVVRLCRAGTLPATKPAGTWLISRADLEAHLEATSNQQPQQQAAAS